MGIGSISEGVAKLLNNATSGEKAEGYNFNFQLKGDLQGMAEQEAILARSGVTILLQGGIPGLKNEEDFKRAVFILFNTDHGHLYAQEYAKYYITPKEEVVYVNRLEPGIIQQLKSAPIYQKFGSVQARKAVPGEEVVTTLANGIEETRNTASRGDWVVTSPEGEMYILNGDYFFSRYEPTPTPNTFRAKGYCRAIPNPFNAVIRITAEWGQIQTGAADCLFADMCDENGGRLAREPYIIARSAFEKTYKLKT